MRSAVVGRRGSIAQRHYRRHPQSRWQPKHLRMLDVEMIGRFVEHQPADRAAGPARGRSSPAGAPAGHQGDRTVRQMPRPPHCNDRSMIRASNSPSRWNIRLYGARPIAHHVTGSADLTSPVSPAAPRQPSGRLAHRHRGDIHIIDPDGAGDRRRGTGESPQQRGFSRRRWATDDADHLSRRGVHRHIFDDAPPAQDHRYPFGVQTRRGHVSPRRDTAGVPTDQPQEERACHTVRVSTPTGTSCGECQVPRGDIGKSTRNAAPASAAAAAPCGDRRPRAAALRAAGSARRTRSACSPPPRHPGHHRRQHEHLCPKPCWHPPG